MSLRLAFPRLSLFAAHPSTPPPKSPTKPGAPAPASRRRATSTSTSTINITDSPTLCLPPPTAGPPPAVPAPWVWTCHGCMAVYRLGTTQRCLLCSYRYCSPAAVLPPAKAARRAPGGKRRRRRSGSCATSFDYDAWTDWAEWRRRAQGRPAVTAPPRRVAAAKAAGANANANAAATAGLSEREQSFLSRTHDCWADCEHPSQCHRERHRLADEMKQKAAEEERLANNGRRPPMSPLAEEEEEDEPVNAVKAEEPRKEDGPARPFETHPDDLLPIQEAITVREPSEDTSRAATSWWRASRGNGKRGSIKSTSPAVDAASLDQSQLLRLLLEDDQLMPLQEGTAAPNGSSNSLTVRNPTEADLESWSDEEQDSDDGTSSDEDSSSSASSASSEEDVDNMCE